jgi:hypothetical protein
MNSGFDELTVINGTDARNQTESESGTRVGSGNNLFLCFWRAARRCRVLAVEEVSEAWFAIDAPSYIADALCAERPPAMNAERHVLGFRVIEAIH